MCLQNIIEPRTIVQLKKLIIENSLFQLNSSGLSNDEFTFDAAGDGPARYNIIHYRRARGSGVWEWVKVGTFNNEKLDINMSGIW